MPSSLYVPLCVSFPVHAGAKPISDILTHKDFFLFFPAPCFTLFT